MAVDADLKMASEVRQNRHAILWFVASTFGLTWSLWSLLWIFGIGTPTFASNQIEKFTYAGIATIGMFFPGLSALLVTRFILGESWRSTAVNHLGRLRFYFWAWLLPLVVVFGAIAISVLLGIARYDANFEMLATVIAASGKPQTLPLSELLLIQTAVALLIGPLINSPFTVGEELGWRGFLLPRLMKSGFSQWQALIGSGMVWGLWHAPLIVRGFNYPDHPYVGVPLMIVMCALMGIILGWMRLESGSVWAPALAHGGLNATGGLALVVLKPGFDYALAGTVASAMGWLMMLIVIAWLIFSRRLPVRKEEPPFAPQSAAPAMVAAGEVAHSIEMPERSGRSG